MYNCFLPVLVLQCLASVCAHRGVILNTYNTCKHNNMVSYKDHVTNEEVHAKIQQAIRLHKDLLTIVKRCKLQWCGQVSRSSGLAKTIVQGTVKGGRRHGRLRKRWEDNREWTGLEFGRSQRAVENRENGGNWL